MVTTEVSSLPQITAIHTEDGSFTHNAGLLVSLTLAGLVLGRITTQTSGFPSVSIACPAGYRERLGKLIENPYSHTLIQTLTVPAHMPLGARLFRPLPSKDNPFVGHNGKRVNMIHKLASLLAKGGDLICLSARVETPGSES